MTSTTISPDTPRVAHDDERLMKRSDREWLRVMAAFAVLAAIMTALTLGQLGLAVLLRWLLSQ
jgi:hypothetical protein